MIESLKKYIEYKGLKKSKVAELLGITPVYLSYLLNDKKTASLDLEDKIKSLIR